jgi:hypothetical protein
VVKAFLVEVSKVAIDNNVEEEKVSRLGCYRDKRRNNLRFSQFSCIDENLRLKKKEKREE